MDTTRLQIPLNLIQRDMDSTYMVCDTIVARVLDEARTMPVAAQTSAYDVWIVAIVCTTVVLVSLIAAGSILSWKVLAHRHRKELDGTKRQAEDEARMWKHMTELKDKYLAFQQEITGIPDKAEKWELVKTVKDHCATEREALATWLKTAIQTAEKMAKYPTSESGDAPQSDK